MSEQGLKISTHGLDPKSAKSILSHPEPTPEITEIPILDLVPAYKLTEINNFDSSTLSLHALNQSILKEESSSDFESKTPDQIQNPKSIFSKSDSRELPPHRDIYHRIVLKEGSQPPFGKLYGMTREDLEALHE